MLLAASFLSFIQESLSPAICSQVSTYRGPWACAREHSTQSSTSSMKYTTRVSLRKQELKERSQAEENVGCMTLWLYTECKVFYSDKSQSAVALGDGQKKKSKVYFSCKIMNIFKYFSLCRWFYKCEQLTQWFTLNVHRLFL